MLLVNIYIRRDNLHAASLREKERDTSKKNSITDDNNPSVK